MKLPVDSLLKDFEIAAVNNPLGDAGDPVLPFVWKQPMVLNQKIQIEDQCLNEQGNPEGEHITGTIYMPQYGMSNTVLNQSFFALKHGYEYFQHVQTMVFLNPKKHGELFAKTLLDTAASQWAQVTREFKHNVSGDPELFQMVSPGMGEVILLLQQLQKALCVYANQRSFNKD